MSFNLKSYLTWIVLVVAGIAVVIIGVRQKIAMSKDPIDLNDPDFEWSELQDGDRVEMDIKYLFDPFSNVTNSSGKETARHYAMPRIISSEDNEYWNIVDYIAVDVKDSSEFAAYDKLADATIDWWIDDDAYEFEPETIHINGVVRKMTSEQQGFFREYLEDLEYDADFIDGTQYQLGIYPFENYVGLIIGIGAIAIVAGAAVIVIKLVRKK